MGQAFIIMQIGNTELDEIFKSAIVPAVKACGLDVKRVDKHNEGGLLKSEIISFIENSEIIIADLTNERPNCYLEIGYAMGVDKFKNLIMTVREDHFPESPNFIQGGPKIHFDLSGYDLLAWYPEKINDFREELEKRIRRRLLIISPSQTLPQESIWDEEWIQKHRAKAKEGFKRTNNKGAMEVRFSLAPPKLSKTQTELSEAAQVSQIHTFGWPIGVILNNVPESRPHPTTEGIVAEIFADSYDYWTIKKTGDFYSLISLFEDRRASQENIFFETRIVRITEAILYCARLYSKLGVDRSQNIYFTIRYTGIKNRILISGNPDRWVRGEYKSIEDEVEESIVFTLQKVESDLVELVKTIARSLFVIFDFFELSDRVYEDIVEKFTKGQL